MLKETKHDLSSPPSAGREKLRPPSRRQQVDSQLFLLAPPVFDKALFAEQLMAVPKALLQALPGPETERTLLRSSCSLVVANTGDEEVGTNLKG